MKTLLIYVFIGICLIMKGASETLNCYICDDCNILDDSHLTSCPLLEATNSPTTFKPTTLSIETTKTTESTAEPTKSESKEPPLEIISTTVTAIPTQIITDPPKTEEPITVTQTTQKTETTSVKTGETKPTETIIYRPTTIEDKQPSPESSLETDRPTNNIPEFTETIRPSSTNDLNTPSPTDSSEFNNPTNGYPESSEVEPVEEISPSTILVNPVVTTDTPSRPVSMTIQSPSTQVSLQTFNQETVNSIDPDPESIFQTSQNTEPYQIFNRLPRGNRLSRAASSYHCYSINIHDGDTKKVKKGCIAVPEDKGACEVLKDEFGKSVDTCKICTEDKCNSSSIFQYSLITLVMVLVLSLYS
ncbi:mucin-2-like [Eupeodes corollae]|uniref:mucin-2-like n=1 Tax=Eupeodes corollae TaxID=290404 RepID=UPI002491ACF6|nr:mucin-2-like [Eupeodes corollae]